MSRAYVHDLIIGVLADQPIRSARSASPVGMDNKLPHNVRRILLYNMLTRASEHWNVPVCPAGLDHIAFSQPTEIRSLRMLAATLGGGTGRQFYLCAPRGADL